MPEKDRHPTRVYKATIALVNAVPMTRMLFIDRLHEVVTWGINRQQYHHDGYTKAIADITAAVERGETLRAAGSRLLAEYRP